MPLPRTRSLAMLVPIWVSVSGCPGGGGGSGVGTTGTSGTSAGRATGSATNPATSLDSTGAPGDPCSDDYDGNHDIAAAFALGLETTDTARATFGDQTIIGLGNEQGEDRLVVCPGTPDFFSIVPVCAGYLGVDLRRLDGGTLDLFLYTEGTEIGRAVGTWYGFYLKPLHRPVDPQGYTIEVRHASGGAQPYSLDVYLLATAPCS
jgi:hypothetical protein